jgi:hypothetical protein
MSEEMLLLSDEVNEKEGEIEELLAKTGGETAE